jgi:hypothetical protein
MGKLRSTLRILPFLCALAVLAGCATEAEQRSQRANAVSQAGFAQYKACIAAARANPRYAALIPHFDNLETHQYTMAQLTDEALPSPSEAALVAAFYDDTSPCGAGYMQALSTVRPDVVPIVADFLSKDTGTFVLIVQQKITWAAAARAAQSDRSDVRARLNVADQRWTAELNASHQAELAQRAAAADALSQWAAQQQMINAANRPAVVVPSAPVVTTCRSMGGFVNCISQ